MFPNGSIPGIMECFTVQISSDNLLEGQEVLVLEASSEDAIISSIFDGLGDADGDIGDEILECAGMAPGEPFIDCIDDISDSYPTDALRNTTFIPLIITDGDTNGVLQIFSFPVLQWTLPNQDLHIKETFQFRTHAHCVDQTSRVLLKA